jgi:seryl-tRNA synthetase
MADALGDIATELYALPLDGFTKARNERATDARASGDRDLADSIKQLKKPSTSAWAVNMLARHRAEQVGQLLELGASLREAQSELNAEELRELGKQRQKLIAAVVRQARNLADELGDPIGPAAADEVGQTLQAALADPDAADAVMAGLLAKPLAASGWGSVDVDAAVAVAAPKPKARVTSITSKQIAKAKRRLKDAEEALEKHEAEAERLGDKLDELVPRRKGLTSEIEELEERVTGLHKQLAAVDKERASLERQREEALAVVDRAEANLDDAVAEVNRLS